MSDIPYDDTVFTPAERAHGYRPPVFRFTETRPSPLDGSFPEPAQTNAQRIKELEEVVLDLSRRLAALEEAARAAT